MPSLLVVSIVLIEKPQRLDTHLAMNDPAGGGCQVGDRGKTEQTELRQAGRNVRISIGAFLPV